MNDKGLVGEFVVSMQVAVMPQYLLGEAEGNDGNHQDIGKSAEIRSDVFRSIDATTSLQKSQL